jgi:hypothetical protein
MNILILTPDAVGSTLLQRVLTMYMQFHEFDRPVINLHELGDPVTADSLQLAMTQEQAQWQPGSVAPAIAQS